MADDKRNDSANGGGINGAGDSSSSSAAVATSGEDVRSAPTSGVNSGVWGGSSGSRNGIGLADRLAEIVLGGECDLLLQQTERESNFLQWLQALDMQVMGACRSDERMKPLLKANVSGVAEDRLLTYLSEHFEAAEVGLLARCLCIPLVSIRVGKIVKHGTTLCPTSLRGNLNVALLPSSGLRITFVGDDGQAERIAIVSGISESSSAAVEEIASDESGRSFLIRVPDAEVFYFWLSEKSKLLGKELLSKIKDLLKRKPTLASFTGISESRLDHFATHLQATLVGSNLISRKSSTTQSSTTALNAISDLYEPGQSSGSSLSSAKPSSHYQHNGGQAMKTPTLSSLRITSREKSQPHCTDFLPSVSSSGTKDSISHPSDQGKKFPEVQGSNSVSALTFLESLRNVSLPPNLSAESGRLPVGSPYYCWCPPSTSPSPLSSQLPLPVTSLPGFLAETATPPLRLAGVPPLDFPSSLHPNQSSQQIPTFTPLMCDPIVHIPVIDVCSSGQGYLVSTGPTAIATAIPPLMIPKTESTVEKGARETLRLLISSSSSQPDTSLMGILPLPAALDADDKPGLLVAGSRGLYSGTSDFDAAANGISSGSSSNVNTGRGGPAFSNGKDGK